MKVSEEYLQCRTMAIVLNGFADEGCLIHDNNDYPLSGGRFQYEDENMAIMYVKEDVKLMYCGKDGWGEPDPKVFEEFTVYTKPRKLKQVLGINNG